MSVSPDIRGMMAAAAVLFFGSFVVLLSWRAYESKRMTQHLADMKSLENTLAMAAMDGRNAGDGFRFPADIGAKSTREYLSRFEKDGYFSKEELDRLLAGNHIAVANISASDPADTAFLLSYDNNSKGGFVIFFKNGGGGVFKREQDIRAVNLPKREPQILP